MKWGVFFFVKKKGKTGFFVKSGKWGVFFVKKWKTGGVFCNEVALSSTQGALCTVSVFFILHFTYLGGVLTQRTPLPIRA